MKNETIVDRVVERLKSQPLGDLITEEDLHEIVKQAIPKVFFEKQRISQGSGYHQTMADGDPLMVEIMRGLLKDAAKTLAQQWLTENAEMVTDHWKKVMDAGLFSYVQKLQDEMATGQIRTALAMVIKPINDERMRQGLPQIYL